MIGSIFVKWGKNGKESVSEMDHPTFLKVISAVSLGMATLSAPPVYLGAKKNAAEMMDRFSHILPRKYNEGLLRKSSPCYNLEANCLRPARIGLDLRCKATTKEILIPRSYERK